MQEGRGHDLGVINAAIALGDPVVPPNGTVLEFAFSTANKLWIVVGYYKSDYFFTVKVSLMASALRRTMTYRVPDDTLFPIVVDVPIYVPPFEKWVRFVR